MKTYRVTWEIDIEAETPGAAARQALEIHRDPDSLATVFRVDGKLFDIDTGGRDIVAARELVAVLRGMVHQAEDASDECSACVLCGTRAGKHYRECTLTQARAVLARVKGGG